MKKGESNKNNSDGISEFILIPIFFIILFALTFANASTVGVLKNSEQQNIAQNSSSISEIQNQISIKTEVVEEQAEEKKISLSSSFEYSSNLQDKEDPDSDTSSSIILAPTYKISDKAALDARLDLIQEHQKDERIDLSNLIIIGTPHTFEITKNLKFQPKVATAAATSEQSRDNETYQGSISLRPTLTLALDSIKGLTLANVVYLNRNFHEFEFKRDGSQNTEYSFRNRFRVLYQVTDKIYFDTLNDYIVGRTYSGISKESFLFSQEIGLEFAPTWTVYISHVNEGSTRGPNNSGDNVDVFNERSSKFGIGLTKVL